MDIDQVSGVSYSVTFWVCRQCVAVPFSRIEQTYMRKINKKKPKSINVNHLSEEKTHLERQNWYTASNRW